MAFCRDLPVAFGLAQKRDTVLQLVFERAADPRLKQRQHRGFLRGKLREVVAKVVVDGGLDLQQQPALSRPLP